MVELHCSRQLAQQEVTLGVINQGKIWPQTYALAMGTQHFGTEGMERADHGCQVLIFLVQNLFQNFLASRLTVGRSASVYSRVDPCGQPSFVAWMAFKPLQHFLCRFSRKGQG